MSSNKSPFVEVIGVIMGLMGLTCLMIGTLAFPIAGAWKNSFSLTFLPVGAVLLAGSAFIVWRLAAVLLLPAGIIGLAMSVIQWSNAAEGAETTPYVVPVVAGALFIVASIAVNLPALLKGGPGSRRGLVGANVVLMCIIGLVLVGVVNYLASLYYNKRDLTKTGKFTLAGKTVSILQNLEEPIKVTVVVQPGAPIIVPAFGPIYGVYDFARNMLEDYAHISGGKLSVTYIDPMTEREKALGFFKELKGGDKVHSIIFQSSHAFKQVPYDAGLLEQMDPYARMRGVQQEPKFQGESAFTAAVIKITDTKKSVIYFTVGKGELPLESAGGREPTMSAIAKYIKDDNYELKPLNLAGGKTIPDDCDILAIVRPKFPFSTFELDLISEYLDDHGKLLAALEPTDNEIQSSGLERLLEDWGVRVRTGVLAINIQRTIFGVVGGADVYAEHPPHEITEKMGTTATLFDISCMVEPVQPPRGPQGQPMPTRYINAPLAATSKDGYGEVNLVDGKSRYDPGVDVAGPVPLAVCSTERDPNMPPPNPYAPPPPPDPNFDGARIVVVGDSDFLNDLAVRRGPGNVDFTLNCINWLAKKTARLDISAKPIFAEGMTVKPQEGQAIFYTTLFGLPYLALVTGGIVYWRRSR